MSAHVPSAYSTRRNQLVDVLRRLIDPATPICTNETGAAHARLYIGLHRDFTIADADPRTVI